ncbi:MAG: hypothetical protein ACRD1Q_03600 [Vicinamibacterales bacterium]
MTLMKQLVAGACGLLLCTLVVATVQAQGLPDQKTYFTFSQAVELPGGVMLPAGTYTFKLADTSGSRNVVQVFNEDESKILAMFMTVSATRLEPAEDSVITFAEAPASAPQPVRFWYYPGRTIGHEFVYPMDQARRIAQLTKTRVLGTDAKIRDSRSADQAKVQQVEPSGATAEFDPNASRSAAAGRPAPRTAPAAGATRAEAQPRAQEPRQPTPRGTSGQAPESQSVRRELPATAGFDPLIGLIGLISLGGFFAARLRVR